MNEWLISAGVTSKPVDRVNKVRSRRFDMNWDQIAGDWKQFTGKAKEKWGKLTDNDLTTAAGKRRPARRPLAATVRLRQGAGGKRTRRVLEGAEAVSAPSAAGARQLDVDGRGQPDSRAAAAGTSQNPITTKETRTMPAATKHAACEHHHQAAAHHAAAAHHHLEAAHHHDVGEHEAAKQHAEAAHEHGEHAHKAAATARPTLEEMRPSRQERRVPPLPPESRPWGTVALRRRTNQRARSREKG